MSERILKIRLNSFIATIISTSAVFICIGIPWISLLSKAAELMPVYYTVIYSVLTVLFLGSIFYLGFIFIYRAMIFNAGKIISKS